VTDDAVVGERAREPFADIGAEPLSHDDLVRERYRGIRPAPVYPACPDHTEKRTLFSLLDAPSRAGITLTESLARLPPASVRGPDLAHPEARSFAVGRLGKDQVAEYARRKGMPLAEVERWLAPKLGYEAEGARAECGRGDGFGSATTCWTSRIRRPPPISDPSRRGPPP